MVAIAPGLTIGLVRPSELRSTADSALNGSPVAFTPIRSRTSSGPSAAQARANTNGLATLMIEKGTVLSPAEWVAPVTPVTAMPKRSGSAVRSAGYTSDTSPVRTGSKRR